MLMSDFQHRARKRFGQNFLHDQSVLQKMVDCIAPKAEDRLLEIGPGQGALTLPLAQRLQQLHAIEIDRDLIAYLQSLPALKDRVVIHELDALKLDLIALLPDFNLLAQTEQVIDMHFLLQKEVVDRLCAQPGGSDYGRLSVMVQYQCQTQPLFTVSPGAFKPAPKVNSAFVRLIPYRTLPIKADNEAFFALLVNTAFQQRRKMLRKSLKKWLTGHNVDEIGIDPSHRPETLSVGDFVRLSNLLQPS